MISHASLIHFHTRFYFKRKTRGPKDNKKIDYIIMGGKNTTEFSSTELNLYSII